MFEKLAELATTPALQQLVLFVRNTWIENEIWSPSTWSVFMFSVRTNNNCIREMQMLVNYVLIMKCG